MWGKAGAGRKFTVPDDGEQGLAALRAEFKD
jgi:hypothetical protein